MKGYGLTVFEGTKPDRFDVEVIDVLQNFRPRQDLILIKTKHPRLEVAKVVAGMSGSPVFLNGKMAGAYAYGWTFGSEAVAGVTPIRNMIEDIDRPLPKIINGWRIDTSGEADKLNGKQARATTNSMHRFAGSLNHYDLSEHANQMAHNAKASAPSDSALRPVATPLLIGGMTGAAIEVARDLFSPLGLEPMQAGGGGGIDPNAPTRYENGGAIGIQLIRGDMSAMGLGTVTRVEGDKLVAFGHPMLESGITALPASVGKVLWFLASTNRSFKIGMPVRPVGALINDRTASIVVSHSAHAPVIPVTLDIKGVPGAPYTHWQFEVAHEKFMAPSFVAVALGNALQAMAAERQDVTWVAKSRLKVQGHGQIEFEDFGVSVGGTPDPREFIQSNLVRAIGALLNNTWEPIIVERADMQIELRMARDVLRLRGAELLDKEVKAGQTARIRLTLVPYAGPTTYRTISVPIPPHLAGETVTLSIRPGYMVDREQPDPENVPDLIANLRDPIYPPKSVVVSYSQDAGVTFKGQVARNLPPGALDAIRPVTASIAPVPFKSEVRYVTTLPDYMTGQDSVSVEVKRVLK